MERVKWDWYRDEDKGERLALHAALEQRVGRKFDCPDLMERPVLAAVVGRVGGKIEHVIFVEAEAEVQSGSPNVLTAADLAEPIAMLVPVLQSYKIRMTRAFVPTAMLKHGEHGRKAAIERTLNKIGFTKEKSSLLRQFYRWIPPSAGKDV